MKLGRLNHVGVATPSIERSLELYRAMFGAELHGAPFDGVVTEVNASAGAQVSEGAVLVKVEPKEE